MAQTNEEEMERKRQWRVSPEEMERLRSYVLKFEGTHNFHNYTVGKEYKDRSNNRYMMKIEVRDPAVYGDTEWISVRIHGQSFMLHQIRKMISMVILSCRSKSPPRLIPETYGSQTIQIPKAPSLGLLLEQPQFGSYNLKVDETNGQIKKDDPDGENHRRDPIDYEIYREEIDKFKVKYIYERMREEEAENHVFDTWLRSVDSYSGDDFGYLNPRGIIPPSAVVKRDFKKRREGRKKGGEPSASTEPKVATVDSDDSDVDISMLTSADMEG